MNTDILYNKFIADIKEKHHVANINPGNIAFIVVKLVEHIERFVNTDGPGKREMFNRVLNDVLDAFNIVENDEVQKFLRNNLDSLISVIIDVSKGKYDINTRSINQFLKKLARKLRCC